MLSVRNVTKAFGGIRAIDQCSIDVPAASITGLIGPNGAGKTTLFDVISGFLRPDSGQVWFDGERIDALRVHEIARRGLVRTFQIPRALKGMSVMENLMLVPAGQTGESLWGAWLRPARVRADEESLREKALGVLEFLELKHLAWEYAGNLSVGQKKLLELARGLMADPAMILLDEPAAGVNPTLVRRIAQHIRALKERGTTFLLIEHNMELVMDLCDRIIVMNNGRPLLVGTPHEVRSNPAVLEAYLGA